MKKLSVLFFIVLGILFIHGCTQKPKEQALEAPAPTSSVSTKTITARNSADSLNMLTDILLECLLAKNKEKYISYCFTEEQETAMAAQIADKKMQKSFQREFGFSLHEEVLYFENIIKYIEKNQLDLAKVDKTIIETIDYNKSNYSPLILKEVIIPIIQGGIERDLFFVAAFIDGKWYFTSELSL
ncbi:MAG: hypothetical protein NW207_11280 [Cytophagales bacterium]|nr:hypothetical protein [Cytophagales bacterium]